MLIMSRLFSLSFFLAKLFWAAIDDRAQMLTTAQLSYRDPSSQRSNHLVKRTTPSPTNAPSTGGPSGFGAPSRRPTMDESKAIEWCKTVGFTNNEIFGRSGRLASPRRAKSHRRVPVASEPPSRSEAQSRPPASARTPRTPKLSTNQADYTHDVLKPRPVQLGPARDRSAVKRADAPYAEYTQDPATNPAAGRPSTAPPGYQLVAGSCEAAPMYRVHKENGRGGRYLPDAPNVARELAGIVRPPPLPLGAPRPRHVDSALGAQTVFDGSATIVGADEPSEPVSRLRLFSKESGRVDGALRAGLSDGRAAPGPIESISFQPGSSLQVGDSAAHVVLQTAGCQPLEQVERFPLPVRKSDPNTAVMNGPVDASVIRGGSGGHPNSGWSGNFMTGSSMQPMPDATAYELLKRHFDNDVSGTHSFPPPQVPPWEAKEERVLPHKNASNFEGGSYQLAPTAGDSTLIYQSKGVYDPTRDIPAFGARGHLASKAAPLTHGRERSSSNGFLRLIGGVDDEGIDFDSTVHAQLHAAEIEQRNFAKHMEEKMLVDAVMRDKFDALFADKPKDTGSHFDGGKMMLAGADEPLGQGEHVGKGQESHFEGGSMSLQATEEDADGGHESSPTKASRSSSHFEGMIIPAWADDGSAFDSIVRLERAVAARKRSEAAREEALLESIDATAAYMPYATEFKGRSLAPKEQLRHSLEPSVAAAQRLAQKRVRAAGARRQKSMSGGTAAALIASASGAGDSPDLSGGGEATSKYACAKYTGGGVSRALGGSAPPSARTHRKEGKRVVKGIVGASQADRDAAELACKMANRQAGMDKSAHGSGPKVSRKGRAEFAPVDSAMVIGHGS